MDFLGWLAVICTYGGTIGVGVNMVFLLDSDLEPFKENRDSVHVIWFFISLAVLLIGLFIFHSLLD
jgi:hypothetical protein